MEECPSHAETVSSTAATAALSGSVDPFTTSRNAHRQKRKQQPFQQVKFTARVSDSLPHSPYQISALLQYFSARSIIDLVCCMLSECRMVLHSRNLSKLPMVCEALRVLIYPLKWSHVYLPVIPKQLLGLVEAPVPFMLGTHTDWLHTVPADFLLDNDLVVSR